jgi:hypothetical protein
VTQNERPSAFVDSPEDLVRKARAAVEGGNLEPQVAVLMTDLARELSKSREGHASRMSMLSANGQEMQDLRGKIAALQSIINGMNIGTLLLRRVILALAVISFLESVGLVVMVLR